MRNNEFKIYKGMRIVKISGKEFKVNGKSYRTYDEAKKDIDYMIAEDQALEEIDRYVGVVCGGWL